jgi:hypothetical protein
LVLGAIVLGGALSTVTPASLDPVAWAIGAAVAAGAYWRLLRRRGIRPLRPIALVVGPAGVFSGAFGVSLAAWACDSGGCSVDESRAVAAALALFTSSLVALTLGWWRPRDERRRRRGPSR